MDKVDGKYLLKWLERAKEVRRFFDVVGEIAEGVRAGDPDKEIYEGDIIKYMDGNNMVVQWSSSGYIGWELYRKKKMGKNIHHVKYMYYDHSPYPNAHEEVIGNIHRNPELLE